MNKRWLYAVYAVIVLVAIGIGLKRSHPTPSTPSQKWQTRNPVLSLSSYPLALGQPWTSKTKSVSLPRSQLATAEWFWPITGSSSVSYILHDGRARWVVGGHAYSLKNPPDDPNDQFASSSDGSRLGWVNPGGGVTVLDRQGARDVRPEALAVAFNSKGHPVWLLASHHVQVGSDVLKWQVVGVPAKTHPFIDRGRLVITNRKGTVESMAIPGGKVRVLARVRPNRWPSLVTARDVSGATALVLERPAPIPRYLILWVQGQSVGWYRFSSPTPPEIGVLAGRLILQNVPAANGHFAVMTNHQVHPLSIGAGIFSESSRGIIWQNNSGFTALYEVSP